jgi:hypothetical protein
MTRIAPIIQIISTLAVAFFKTLMKIAMISQICGILMTIGLTMIGNRQNKQKSLSMERFFC